MKQYIDKSALVAEIERIQKKLNIDDIGGRSVMAWSEVFKSFIDTLEVKEVDLEKEIEKYAYSLPHSVTGTTSYVSDIKSPIARMFGVRHDWSYKYVEQIAEHFYVLGLKATQKGE